MSTEVRPLSQFVAQGWEVISHAPMADYQTQTFLLRRQKLHKLVTMRRKVFGDGFVVKEIDL